LGSAKEPAVLNDREIAVKPHQRSQGAIELDMTCPR
jgi:hypothetical protein